MGHRALIVYERPDGLYNLHYAHWGGLHLRLTKEITPITPFGGPDTDSEWVGPYFDQLLNDTTDPDHKGYSSAPDHHTATVETTPLARGLDLEAVLTEHLDYLHREAFYIVDRDFDVTAYRTLWFDLQDDAESPDEVPTVGNGALMTVRWYDGEPVGDGYVQGEFQGLKKTVVNLVDRGLFAQDEAVAFMKDRLCAWADDRESLIIRTPG